MSKPTGNVYKLSKISDIFNLPTTEEMKRCLKQLEDMMVTARNTADLLNATAASLAQKDGIDMEGGFGKFVFPDPLTWTDDEEDSEMHVMVSDSKESILHVGVHHAEGAVSLNGVKMPASMTPQTD